MQPAAASNAGHFTIAHVQAYRGCKRRSGRLQERMRLLLLLLLLLLVLLLLLL